MTDPQIETVDQPRPSRAWGLLGGPHFVVAAIILLIAAAGWGVAVQTLKLYTEKFPVPWPKGVEVNDEFVMTSMPDSMDNADPKIGPFVFVSGDGEIDFRDGAFHKDGLPDGETPVREDVMELLGIGTVTDERNLPLRRSNWMSMRTYRDIRRPPGDPLRFWQLRVYYYTGGVDLVPHVGDVCILAGGGTVLSSDDMPIAIAGAEGPWGGSPVKFRRLVFQPAKSTAEFVQYYVFSINGQPRNDRNAVRWELGMLNVKHAFFAKIEFAPLPVVQKVGNRLVYSIPRPEEVDAAAGDFVQHVMPSVLKTLPTAQDVAELDKAGTGKEKP